VFAQFGNLYPVMSRRLIDLNKYEDVVQSRAVLALSLALPIEDPNHMPVTRDLSESKRRMLLAWLNERDANGFVLRRDRRRRPASGCRPSRARSPPIQTRETRTAHRTLIALQSAMAEAIPEPDHRRRNDMLRDRQGLGRGRRATAARAGLYPSSRGD
jgi:hypothetical protein